MYNITWTLQTMAWKATQGYQRHRSDEHCVNTTGQNGLNDHQLEEIVEMLHDQRSDFVGMIISKNFLSSKLSVAKA